MHYCNKNAFIINTCDLIDGLRLINLNKIAEIFCFSGCSYRNKGIKLVLLGIQYVYSSIDNGYYFYYYSSYCANANYSYYYSDYVPTIAHYHLYY